MYGVFCYFEVPLYVFLIPSFFLYRIESTTLSRSVTSHWAHRFLLAVIPGVTLVALAVFIIWGDKGLVRHMELKTELVEANERLAEVQRENQRILRKLKAMESDDRLLERIAGEELNMGVKGARIIRFEHVEDEVLP